MTEYRRGRDDSAGTAEESLTTPAPEADTTLLPEGAGDEAADSPTAVEDYGLTVAEEAQDEPLSQRLRRELPDLAARRRAVDPDRLAANRFAGRLVNDDGAHVADGDVSDVTAEEAAMHLMPQPSEQRPPGAQSHAERLDALEAEVSVLLDTARVHTQALQMLADALHRMPGQEPGEAAAKVSRAAHDVHDLLLALRVVAG